MRIFHHVDDDGDEISFFSDERSPLSVEVKPVNEQSYIGYLDRDAVLRLHAALGEWLYPVHTPEWANKSLIEQMIERAVRDQVAAVLPLHLKPFATQMQAAEDKVERVANAVLTDPEPGDRLLVADADGRVWADPEPHDVGHAEEPADHGRLMSELPVRTRPRPLCVSCGHGWGEHTAGVCWGTSQTPEGAGCTCTRERPDSPASNPWDCKLCGHPNSVHVPATGECLECACRPGGGE